MKKSFVGMGTLGLMLIWFAQTLSAPPAEVYRITPPQGQAGRTGVIHGTALLSYIVVAIAERWMLAVTPSEIETPQ